MAGCLAPSAAAAAAAAAAARPLGLAATVDDRFSCPVCAEVRARCSVPKGIALRSPPLRLAALMLCQVMLGSGPQRALACGLKVDGRCCQLIVSASGDPLPAQVVHDPVVLKCHHIFCRECVTIWASRSGTRCASLAAAPLSLQRWQELPEGPSWNSFEVH